jgi:ABC-type transporter Mla subunit MlaD
MDSVPPELKDVLWLLLEEIEQQREATVTKTDFNQLRDIVRDLAEAQKRTGQRIEELAEAQQRTGQRMDTLAIRMEELVQAQQRTEQRMEELAEAQKRTEQRVEELAEAQNRTEQRVDTLAIRMEELAEAQKRTEQRMEELAEAQMETSQEIATLNRAHDSTRSQLGGLSRTMAYALENEAYRMLPAFLKAQHQLDISERLVRTWINGEEINFYARGQRGGESVVIVGESVMRLDDRGKLAQLQRKLDAVRAAETAPLVPLLVTHFAHPELLEQARRDGIVVAQSFEWG